MKKKLLVIFGIIFIIIIVMFMLEEGIYFFIKPNNGRSSILVESVVYDSSLKDNTYGVLIYRDGSIYTYQNDQDNIISKKWYRVMYTDLLKVKKYVLAIDGEYEIKNDSGDYNSVDTIYVYRNNEKIKIFESGDIEGQNNSEVIGSLLKIIRKYL